jgi:FKBP-type peptidyl-prolyl cis-trans isomerase SlpA
VTEAVRVAMGDTIRLHLKLSSPNGEVFENTFDDQPMEMILGTNALAPNLEQYLIDLPLHERHVFMLDPAQAFGSSDERLIQRIPLTEFPPDIQPQVKEMIEFQMPNGATMPGVVQNIGASEAIVDFNHPLADCPVIFEVEILEISPAIA